MTPPRVETHATTHPSVRDTLPGAAASNCRAEKAKATPQSNNETTAKNGKRFGLGTNGIVFIVAKFFA